jgi:hypothetical protein
MQQTLLSGGILAIATKLVEKSNHYDISVYPTLYKS